MGDYAVVLCCRIQSDRLPGKTLAVYTHDDAPNLEQIIARWQGSRRSPTIIVSVNEAPNDAITGICKRRNVPVFYRPGNVLDCMAEALQHHCPNAGYVARALGDNPLVDVALADWRLDILQRSAADGLSYGRRQNQITYAGTTDVWSRAAWDRIVAESKDDECEHPGQHFWRNQRRYNVVEIPLPPREYLLPVRTELDTQQDLDMLRRLWNVWAAVDQPAPGALLSTLTALDILQVNPDIAAINAAVPVKTQTQAEWRGGSNWICPNCQARMAGVINGDLEVRCQQCGRPRKWYSVGAVRRSGIR